MFRSTTEVVIWAPAAGVRVLNGRATAAFDVKFRPTGIPPPVRHNPRWLSTPIP
ncbi:MAG: hypothetical protein HYY16_03325 [Planctomycetes bacterium]|nr:hypothetical protein [Planctomycetota bacterium]